MTHIRTPLAPINNLEAVLSVRLARLTTEFQPLSVLKLSPSDGAYGYRDLRDLGLAEERREPITVSGIACGERTLYRLSQTQERAA